MPKIIESAESVTSRTARGQVGPPAVLRVEVADQQLARTFGAFIVNFNDLYQYAHFLLWDIGRLRAEFSAKAVERLRDFAWRNSPDPVPLKVAAININSPGWLEFLGSLNPLKFVHDYTKLWLDHFAQGPQRKLKDEETKIKNYALALQVLEKEVAFLKKLGVAPQEIERIVRSRLQYRLDVYDLSLERAKVIDISPPRRLPPGEKAA